MKKILFRFALTVIAAAFGGVTAVAAADGAALTVGVLSDIHIEGSEFSELPTNAHIRFDVTPVSCFNKRGRTLRAQKTWTREE